MLTGYRKVPSLIPGSKECHGAIHLTLIASYEQAVALCG